MPAKRIIIIGGGMAGLATAYHLRSQPHLEIRLLEQEAMPATHSSGRNAAIFRQLEPTPSLIQMALRSRTLLDQLFSNHEQQWLHETGALYLWQNESALREMWSTATQTSLAASLCSPKEIMQRIPELEDGHPSHGIFIPSDGVIDIHSVTAALMREIRRCQIEIMFNAQVKRLIRDKEALIGVQLSNGAELIADTVIVAAGAWAMDLGVSIGAPLTLLPLRRHLAWLSYPQNPLKRDSPVIWRLDDEVYIRPEGSGYLASPCDETTDKPGIPSTDQDMVGLLEGKLRGLTPALAEGSVGRAWACLRTFAPDRNPVIGPDPRVRGLHWLAGLGGHGMTLGLAAGEMLAAQLMGDTKVDALEFLPDRFTKGSPEVAAHVRP
jgi:D-arginine dehydrogenase